MKLSARNLLKRMPGNWSGIELPKINVVCNCNCLPTEHLAVLKNSLKRVRAFQMELNLEVLAFKKRGVPGEKLLGASERNNNKLNPHMASSTPGLEPGQRWWEASATAPPLLPIEEETLGFYLRMHFLNICRQSSLLHSRFWCRHATLL